MDDWSSLFEFLPIGAYRNAPDGRQLRANPALVRLNGFTTEAEHIAADNQPNRPWYVDAHRRDAFRALLARDGVVTGFESEVRRYNGGERIWVRENAHVVRGADGQVRFYEGTIEDITQQVHAREAVRRSSAELRQIVDLVPGMVYRVLLLPGGERRASFVSRGTRELFGIEPEAFLSDGTLMHRLRHPEDGPRVQALAAERNAAGTPMQVEYRALLPDGSTKWVQAISAAAPDEQGHRVRVGMVFDITARKQAEEALLRSEAQMQQLISLLPGVVFRLRILPDGTRRYSYVSDHVRTLYGVEPEAVLADGEALTRFRHPDDDPGLRAAATAAADTEQPLHYEVRVLLADGTQKWIEALSRPVLGAPRDDGCRERVGLLTDITQRKSAELLLQSQAELWERALEATGDGVWDWRVQEGVELLSPQCKALYGFLPHELPDLPSALDDRTHPHDKPGMDAAREAHFAGRSARYVNDHRVMCKDGSWKWIRSRGLVISRDAAGRPLRMIGTHTDITAARQADAMRVERDRAAAADLAKSQFLSRVSHELRTPLNAILGFAQLLELDADKLGAQHLGWLRQVLSSGRHLLALMDDILDLSSAQTGQLAVRAEAVPLRAVVDEAWTMLARDAQARGVVLHNDLATPGPMLLADRKRLKQVVSNLLSNAIKYNRPGGWVRVSTLVQGDVAEVNVADGGPGLSAEQLARLFSPFDRLGAERGPVPGTGLGLALARQLVESMGGGIGATSRLGEGTMFSVRLPLA